MYSTDAHHPQQTFCLHEDFNTVDAGADINIVSNGLYVYIILSWDFKALNIV